MTLNRRILSPLLILCLFTPLPALPSAKSVAAAPASTQAAPAPIVFTEETLDNGLHVIYAPLHQAPVVHVRVLYHVGSRDERPDRQGFAHMFEHMMFRGSAHVAREEHMKRIGTVGGISNAFTSFDDTVYVNTIPSQYLDMALWLEADRMASFKVSEEIYKTERKVVAEEWRMRNNKPYGTLYEDFLKNAFVKHSYRWTPIGNMEHLRAAPVGELQDFFNTYYVPNNATLVIAGDFDTAAAHDLVARYFQWIPRGGEIPRHAEPEPEQSRPREVDEALPVPLPAVLIGYKLPDYAADDHFALSLLADILGSGDSSRLKRLLVNGDPPNSPQAVDAYAMHMQLEDYGIFGVGAIVLKGKEAQKVQAGLIRTVADVFDYGVTDAELAKAKTQARIALIHGRETAESLASQLGEDALFAHDPSRVNTDLAKLQAVTRADIQRVAGTYLIPQRSTTLRVNPSMLAAASIAAANKAAAAVKEAPVAPTTAGAAVAPRPVTFPENYPTTAPSADARANPDFQKGTESSMNGVRVIVMPDSRLPIVSWSVTLRRGSQSDPPNKEGTAWLTAEMLRRGVEGEHGSFQELSGDLDSRGISISVGDGGDHTTLSGSCTTDQLDHAIERSVAILHHPTFPPQEFGKLKEQSINSLRLGEENPATVASDDLTRTLWGGSVFGRIATPQSVGSITLADVKTFYRTLYQPTDAIVILAGDVTVEQGRALAGKLLSPATGDLPDVDRSIAPLGHAGRRILLIDRPEAKQATVRMGIRAYNLKSDEKFAGSVASQVLSSGIDSRLGKYVRAARGLAYDVRARFDPGRDIGTFTGSTDTAIESTADAIEAMFKVFADMRDGDITPKELSEAQQRVAGGMVMAMQTISQQAGFRLEGLLNGYPIDYYDKYPQRIAQVTAPAVREVVNRYVNDQGLVIVVVAPAAAVKPQLERLGPVEALPMPAQRNGKAGTTRPSNELLKKAA